MDLLLWRHAEADDGLNDLKRKLTKKGMQQAEKMSQWIKKYFPQNYSLWASEAIRSQQTAEYLKHKILIKPILNPSNPLEPILKEIYEHIFLKNILIVGHQPVIGQLTAFLLNLYNYQTPTNLPYWSFKKAGIWWLEIKELDINHFSSKVKAVLTPNLLES